MEEEKWEKKLSSHKGTIIQNYFYGEQHAAADKVMVSMSTYWSQFLIHSQYIQTLICMYKSHLLKYIIV